MRVCATVFLAVAAVLAATGGSAAAEPAAADDLPPSLVEDFAYAGAAEILAEHGVRVLAGDGRIRFVADCASKPDLFQVESLVGSEIKVACFEVLGPRGFVTMDIPNVYLVRGAGQPVVAKATHDGQTETATVPPDTYVPIGGGNATHTLVELRATSTAALPPGTASPHPFVAKVDTGSPVGRGCSGVLVAPQWLVTARSCFAPDAAAGAPPQPATAVVGRADLEKAGGQERTITELVPRTDRDLTLAKLNSPVTDITPIALAAAAPPAGAGVIVAGYGRTGSDWVGRALRTLDFTAGTAAATTLELARPAGTPTSTCKGDAGGPAFAVVGGSPRLYGISVTSGQTGCAGAAATAAPAVEARVDDLATWIRDIVAPPPPPPPPPPPVPAADPHISLYDYSNAQTGLFVFPGASGPSVTPRRNWMSAVGGWDVNRSQPLLGDFNGDQKLDMAAFYHYGGGTTKLWLFNDINGAQVGGTEVWDSGGGWDASRAQPVSGDFNGDGKTDVAAFYHYGGGTTRLWLFNGVGTGAVSGSLAWDSAGGWEAPRAKLVTGDFDGDGKTEIGGLYNYDNSQTKLWLFSGVGSGTVTTRQAWDSGRGNWDWHRIKQVAGDFNRDGKTDLAAFYNYDNSLTRLWRFDGLATGGAVTPTQVWDSGAGNWDWHRIKQVTGDFDGNGTADVGAFYNYDNDLTRLWMFGNVAGPAALSTALVWDSGRGNWGWNRGRPVTARR